MHQQRQPDSLGVGGGLQLTSSRQKSLALGHHPDSVLGFALLEALMALLLLASGVLTLLWTHQHAMALQRQQIMLSVAIGVADDLAERMQLNTPRSADYAKTWGSFATSMANQADCAAQACSRAELAQWDMQQIQQALQTQLPEGDLAVFPLTDAPNWWGILLAWRDDRMTYRTDGASGTPACPDTKSCWRLFFRPAG
jgi:type IV pilus assembly protein PilV